MCIRRFGATVLVLALGAIPARSADLTKIERPLVREPAYQTKTPKYCLLVFGSEAKTRIWLVLDGDSLYVDRNGNGDLTEPNKRIRKANSPNFEVGAVTDADGKTNHGELSVSVQGDRVRMYLESSNCKQYVGYDLTDTLAFAERAQEAPIVHFGGPLTLRFHRKAPAFAAGQACRFNIALGTPGVGKGSFVAVSCCSLPSGVRPLAYVEFPNKDPKGSPIRAEYVLDGD